MGKESLAFIDTASNKVYNYIIRDFAERQKITSCSLYVVLN